MTHLAAYLAETGMKQNKLAELVGIHPSVLSRFLKGDARPSLDTAFEIERVTGGGVPAVSWVREKPCAR
jgi:DNA-binding transcriptional regulator YdaS (Cro superfamily)